MSSEQTRSGNQNTEQTSRKAFSTVKVGSITALALLVLIGYSLLAPDARGKAGTTQDSAVTSKADADTDLGGAAPDASSDQSHFQNGWRQGKIETALMLNDQLKDVDIVVAVSGETATLKGIVANAVQRDLAKSIARGAEGIEIIDDQLQVDPDRLVEEHVEITRSDAGFARALLDSTITAKVKLGLLASDPLAGLEIDVATDGGVVTLSGDVDAEPSRQTAEAVARSTDDVREVVNKLAVSSPSAD